MAKKAKKTAAVPGRAVKKKASTSPKPAKSAARGTAKNAVPDKQLIKKAVKKISTRSTKHSDEWIRKNIDAPAQEVTKRAPSKKKSTTSSPKAPKKLPPITYRGKKIDPELAKKVRDLRAQAVKMGKFLTNKFVLSQYYKFEKQIMQGQMQVDVNDPLKIKEQVRKGVSINKYPLNGVVNQLFNIRQEYGKFVIVVRGFGETTDERFNSFGQGLRKVDMELGLIWTGLEIYAINHVLNSPQFEILMAWDPSTKVAYIDFNKTIFKSVDVNILIPIIISIKQNMEGDVLTQLTDEQLAELEKESPSTPQPKVKDLRRGRDRKEKETKKSKPGKKSAKKKPAAKKKSSKKNKVVYLLRKDGTLDMRYQINRDLAVRREKQRKAAQKRKKEKIRAEKQLAKKYAEAAEKRRQTIARNKRKNKK